ncbi:MAG: hypothetical protein ABR598_09495 [Candidatus Dormibacteria bacterium]
MSLPAAGRFRAAGMLVAGALALMVGVPARGSLQADAASSTVLLRDVRAATDRLAATSQATTPDDYIQPDTQVEPSIAANPNNPDNVVTGYQEGRVAGGGDATNGFATTMDGGRTWTYGEVPHLTSYPGQNGPYDRASDAVVAFGTANDVYYSSLVFSPVSGTGLQSGMAINVSRDGGHTFGEPVFFADDQLAGLNDKNWVVVDNSSAPGHHKGRVYVVWDRIAAVYYDYCDGGCDQLSGWAFGGSFHQLDLGSPYVTQAIGATPVVLNDGSLAVIFNAAAGGVPTGASSEQTLSSFATARLTCVVAPLAGGQPFGTPLVFGPPIQVADNLQSNVRAQRAGTLPSANYEAKTGTLAVTWEDARFHSEAYPVNDVLVSTSSDGGTTWSAPTKVNPSTTTDNIDRYNPSISGDGAGGLHVAYRSRLEGANLRDFSASAQMYYQESTDSGRTWSAPLQVNTPPNNLYNGAFSRNGTFEGDYNGIASIGRVSYIVREEAYPVSPGEPVALVPDPTNPERLTLLDSGKGHQHQQTWVAVVGPPLAASTTSTGPAVAAAPSPTPSILPITGTAVGPLRPAPALLVVLLAAFLALPVFRRSGTGR